MARFLVALAMVVAVLGCLATYDAQAGGPYICDVVVTTPSGPASIHIALQIGTLDLTSTETHYQFSGWYSNASGPGTWVIPSGNLVVAAPGATPAAVSSFIAFTPLGTDMTQPLQINHSATWSADPTINPTSTFFGQEVEWVKGPDGVSIVPIPRLVLGSQPICVGALPDP